MVISYDIKSKYQFVFMNFYDTKKIKDAVMNPRSGGKVVPNIIQKDICRRLYLQPLQNFMN